MKLSHYEPVCCTANLSEFPEEFVKALPTLADTGDLLIRIMKDQLPNVVINLSDVEGIREDYPEIYLWFTELHNKSYEYIFISEDW